MPTEGPESLPWEEESQGEQRAPHTSASNLIQAHQTSEREFTGRQTFAAEIYELEDLAVMERLSLGNAHFGDYQQLFTIWSVFSKFLTMRKYHSCN